MCLNLKHVTHNKRYKRIWKLHTWEAQSTYLQLPYANGNQTPHHHLVQECKMSAFHSPACHWKRNTKPTLYLYKNRRRTHRHYVRPRTQTQEKPNFYLNFAIKGLQKISLINRSYIHKISTEAIHYAYMHIHTHMNMHSQYFRNRSHIVTIGVM